VTAGAWAPALLATAGIRLPVTVTRETVVYFAHAAAESPPALVDWRPPDASAWGLRRDGLAAYALGAGGSSLKAALHQAGPIVDPAQANQPGEPDTAVVGCVADWVSRTFPRVERTPLRAETCLYTSTRLRTTASSSSDTGASSSALPAAATASSSRRLSARAWPRSPRKASSERCACDEDVAVLGITR